MEIINYKEREMIPLTDEEKELDELKVRDHGHYTGKFRGAARSICKLRCKVLKEIPIVTHNGSTYDYHFIIKQLAKEFKEWSFECLGENNEKHITFSIPIKKRTW